MKVPASYHTAEDTALFIAGHTVPAGDYQMLGSGREVRLDHEGTLPASCDGHIAVYRQVPRLWADLTSRSPNHSPNHSPNRSETQAEMPQNA